MSALSQNDPFYSSKFGIQWAQDHIAAFERECEAFLQPDVCSIVSEADPSGVYKLVKLRLLKPMPTALNGHVLDVVYNLRAALDQACYSVAILHGPFKGTPYFPIRTEEAEFERKMRDVRKFYPQEILDLVRSFKPYERGNNSIWALNQLCNTQKHGMLSPLPMGTGSGIIKGAGLAADGPHIPYPFEWDSSKNEMELFRVPVNSKHKMEFNLSFVIAFGNIKIIGGKPVVTVLDKFLDEVDSIVMAIEAESRRIGLI